MALSRCLAICICCELCLSLPFSFFSSNAYGVSMPDSCFPPIPRPDYIKPYIKNMGIVSTTLRGIGYAGDAENPRPVPPLSLSDIKKERQDIWAKINNTIIYAFSRKNVMHKSNDIIPINKWEFWCLVRSGDEVLLTDRNTHHYTSIEYVDREKNVIAINDPWPSKIFLREGNPAGVKANIENGLVVITKAEFQKVIFGLLTPDTPDLIKYYLLNNPDSKKDVDLMFALSSTLLEHGFEQYIYASLEYFRKTLSLIDPIKNQDQYYKIAQRLAFALTQSSYLRYRGGDVVTANKHTEELVTMLSGIDPNKLGYYYSLNDYYKLGNLAGAVDDLKKAIIYYSESVMIDPDFYNGYLYRAFARMKEGDYTSAISDATKSIELIDAKLNSTTEFLKEKDRHGWIQAEKIHEEKKQLIRHKREAYTIRSKSYLSLGKKQESIDDLRKASQL